MPSTHLVLKDIYCCDIKDCPQKTLSFKHACDGNYDLTGASAAGNRRMGMYPS